MRRNTAVKRGFASQDRTRASVSARPRSTNAMPQTNKATPRSDATAYPARVVTLFPESTEARRSVAGGMDAFVVADDLHEIVRPTSRLAGLTLIELCAKQDFRADETTRAVEDKERKGSGPIGRRRVCKGWKALIRVTAYDSVGNWLETGPPSAGEFRRVRVLDRGSSGEGDVRLRPGSHGSCSRCRCSSTCHRCWAHRVGAFAAADGDTDQAQDGDCRADTYARGSCVHASGSRVSGEFRLFELMRTRVEKPAMLPVVPIDCRVR
jgi:hypothetical protein